MPAIRPEAISNRIRLAYEFRALMRGFVAENRAVDPALAAGIEEPSPDEKRIGRLCAEDDFLARSGEDPAPPAVAVLTGRVVPLVEREAVTVAILCEPP